MVSNLSCVTQAPRLARTHLPSLAQLAWKGKKIAPVLQPMILPLGGVGGGRGRVCVCECSRGVRLPSHNLLHTSFILTFQYIFCKQARHHRAVSNQGLHNYKQVLHYLKIYLTTYCQLVLCTNFTFKLHGSFSEKSKYQ